MILVIDCCVRGELSATRKLYESCLDTIAGGRETKIIRLCDEKLSPLYLKDIELRDSLIAKGSFSHEMFEYAVDFKNADEIVIAAPYWDLSFPSLLKVYLERVSVCGVTFGYEGSDCVGYCKADRMYYFSTCGGFTGGIHLGAEYVKALGKMFGIDKFYAYTIEGLDIDESERDSILQKGIEKTLDELKTALGGK